MNEKDEAQGHSCILAKKVDNSQCIGKDRLNSFIVRTVYIKIRWTYFLITTNQDENNSLINMCIIYHICIYLQNETFIENNVVIY